MDLTGPLERFAAAVGPAGPVTCVGGRTQWDVGGPLDAGAVEVSPPAGVVAHEPGEMIVRVRAGTTVAELAEATAVGGQFVALEADRPEQATVGGVLACGRSGLRRLGWGPVRDSVLEVTLVDSTGSLVRAGAPLVKNVTGYDLCRLMVGSVGTLGFLAEVVLRCRPRPELEQWWQGDGVDPFSLSESLYRPLSVLWDGSRTWVGLAGYRADVEDQAAALLDGRFTPVDGPPPRPGPARRSLAPAELRSVPEVTGGTGRWLAEVGVGMLHCDPEAARCLPGPRPSEVVTDLHRRVKARFDPDGRLNPGRSPLAPAVPEPAR